jgi:hypothetical protein
MLSVKRPSLPDQEQIKLVACSRNQLNLLNKNRYRTVQIALDAAGFVQGQGKYAGQGAAYLQAEFAVFGDQPDFVDQGPHNPECFIAALRGVQGLVQGSDTGAIYFTQASDQKPPAVDGHSRTQVRCIP